MLEELLTILEQFDKLAASLAALRAFHGENPETLACLENAEKQARRGAELTRSQIDVLNGKRGGFRSSGKPGSIRPPLPGA